ncbi:MAG: glycerate kinase family protein [Nocardioidaceae bacterium]
MRVVIAPDSFGGTLSAVEAAQAIATGWRRKAPDDDLMLVPMSDGGPGFVEVLHASLGGEPLSVTVPNQYGDQTDATVLMVEGTGYVESAQACGLSLTNRRDPEHATTCGVGQLGDAAIDAQARRIVVGLGGSGTNDGGAGFLSALGAASTPPNALAGGPGALEGLEAVDLGPVLERCSGVEFVMASDVDNPLLGLRGATNVYGPQKGIADDRLPEIDARLAKLADCTNPELAKAKGAGAAGGLGFALLLVGASRVDGIGMVAAATRLAGLARDADLVITGEGSFDFSTRSGKVPYGVAKIAGNSITPCIALAGRVLVGSREMRALGVESAYSLVDLVGEPAAFDAPAQSLTALAERVARTWSR